MLKSYIQIEIVIAGVISFIVSLLVIPLIINVAKKKNLLDTPNHRASHTSPTPTMGGIGIFIGLVTTLFIWSRVISTTQLHYLLVALFILFITGVRDDLKEIKAYTKFAVQIASAFLISYAGIRIESLSGIFGVHEIPLYVQYALTIFVITGVTNAVNLLDGINGLAGGIGFMNSMIFCFLYVIKGEFNYAMVCISLAGSILGFLKYNFNNAKIFMGDTGSLIMGFLLSAFAIKYINIESSSNPYSIVLVFGILVLPIFDTIRVFSIRISKGKSPFSADKNHIHHLLIKTGFNHKKSSITMYLANITLIGIAFLFSYFHFSIIVSLISLFAIAILLSELLTVKKILFFQKETKKIVSEKTKKQAENHLLTKLN